MEQLPHFPNKSESQKENEKKWEAARHEVEKIIDALGLGIDEGIKDTVAILRAMDFPTSSSCAGHTDHNAYGLPYVEVYDKGPEGWKEDLEKQAQWREENLKWQKKLLFFLEEFYADKNVPVDVRLHLSKIGMFGGFRLQSTGVDSPPKLPEGYTKEDVAEIIKSYQNEMKRFTTFLKDKFLSKSTI